MEGKTEYQGRLEVYYKGEWGTVCDDSFDDNDAKVACRQLGLTGGRSLGNTNTPDGTGRTWLDELACRGHESSLSACRHSGWGTENCNHNEDVGIECG